MLYNDDVNREYDLKYEVRLYTIKGKFMIGDSQLDIEGSEIIFKKLMFYMNDYLFKRSPRNFTKDVSENYKQIIMKTNAHRHKPNNQIEGN